MILFKKAAQLAAYFQSHNISQKEVGFVPTMGALHDGHLSLFRQSVLDNPISVCSIFVNPTQFNDPEDFRKYPVTIERDIELIESAGVTILFMPHVEEIYPDGINHLSRFNLGYLEEILEGKYRPGHFQGVSQVMSRLINMVNPGNLYMGQKDYQQCMVIRRLLDIMKSGTTLHTCPTLRETDGLAMSSRNTRLNADERQRAVTISRVLHYLKQNLTAGDIQPYTDLAKKKLEQQDFRVDYIAIADAASLTPVPRWDGQQNIVALIAAYMHDVRLIDNMLLHENRS